MKVEKKFRGKQKIVYLDRNSLMPSQEEGLPAFFCFVLLQRFPNCSSFSNGRTEKTIQAFCVLSEKIIALNCKRKQDIFFTVSPNFSYFSNFFGGKSHKNETDFYLA